MMTAMVRMNLLIQGAPPVTTSQPQRTDQDLQSAARDLREAIRNNINAEVIRARAQGETRRASQATPAVPTPPSGPGEIVIRGQDGRPIITVPPPFGRSNDIPPAAVDI